MHELRGGTGGVQWRARPRPSAGELPAEGRPVSACRITKGRVEQIASAAVRGLSSVAEAAWCTLVSVLLRCVVRRGPTGYPAPVHRAAAGPTLTPKFPANPGLNSGACAGALVIRQI